jgi:hypothetical protein
VASLIDYDLERPGDYYLLSLKSGKETIFEPYEYLIGNEYVTFTSFVSPIIHKAKTIGVVGIDFAMQQLQEISSKVNL